MSSQLARLNAFCKSTWTVTTSELQKSGLRECPEISAPPEIPKPIWRGVCRSAAFCVVDKAQILDRLRKASPMAICWTPPCGFYRAIKRLARIRWRRGMSPDSRSFTNPLIESLVLWLCSQPARMCAHVQPLRPDAVPCGRCWRMPRNRSASTWAGPAGPSSTVVGTGGGAGGWSALSCATVASSTTAMRLLSRHRAACASLPLRTWRWMRRASACSSTVAVVITQSPPGPKGPLALYVRAQETVDHALLWVVVCSTTVVSRLSVHVRLS